MIASVIRFYFQILCSTYVFFRILNLPIFSKKQRVINTIISLCISYIFSLLPYSNFTYKTICLYLVFFLYIKLITNFNLSITLVISVISFSLSFISLAISGFLLCFINITFINDAKNIDSLPYIFIGGIIQYILLQLLFKIKRLKYGMPFLLNNSFLNCGLVICIFIIGYNFIVVALNPIYFPINLFAMFLILLLAIALLVWWRRKITQSYVEKLRVSEVESLYKEISDKDLEIEKLRASNDQLAGIIHKDNKLIPAMELAVRNYLQTAALMKPEDAKQLGADLLANLERMSEDRTGIIRAYQENTSYRQRTGLSSIDAIVDYMENRASSLGIDYHYQYDKGIKEKLSAYISEDDAMHLLSDLIENAIIAASHSEKKVVHIHIGFIQDILFMDISDGGIPFKPETYQNLGMHQHTTHANDGGSGIGLMDLGKLKKQYKFSLQIYEYPIDESVHTKKIRILFDRKNHYLIQSYRAREIRSVVMRNDLHVFQYVDSENEIPILEDKSKRSV